MSMIYAARLRVDEAIAVAERALDISETSTNPIFAQLGPALKSSLERYHALKKLGVTPTSVMEAMMAEDKRRRAAEAAANTPPDGRPDEADDTTPVALDDGAGTQ